MRRRICLADAELAFFIFGKEFSEFVYLQASGRVAAGLAAQTTVRSGDGVQGIW